ncbi:hypothetical protein Ctob_007135 [Chrysochromulina tobinii]|uniref:Uncharacterized protein n=1 Tax=Chrysochromulina tobinii TaxID=1460289 RepID=A0A0M0JSE1_9EUKA|nr:hypothetical protein Ctob_007135 [Chrysochromulina tobinii]|eukprot:KOO29415.1 hypothetical protein Ctob_007135 [Chrysochromulina sp. CCMP291]
MLTSFAGHIVRGTEPPLLVNVHQIDVISTVDVQPGIGSVVNRGKRHSMKLLAETSTIQIVLT